MKDIKEIIKDKKLIIGANQVLSMMKNEKITNVLVASNCPETLNHDIDHYSKIFSIKASRINEDSKELGVICKKPFSISVIGW